jgi:hypothetical protein
MRIQRLARAAILIAPFTWTVNTVGAQVTPLTRDKLDLAQSLLEYVDEIHTTSDAAQKFAEQRGGLYFASQYIKDDIPLDAAFLLEEKGRCIVTFQSTQNNRPDWAQNLDLTVSSVSSKSDPSKVCQVRDGFAVAYLETTFRQDLENAVDDCMTRNNLLILSGHSQGASISLVAAVVFEEYEPLVVAFGSPPAFVASCPYVSTERIWNFINTEVDAGMGSGMKYDPVPFADTIFTLLYKSLGSVGFRTLGFLDSASLEIVQKIASGQHGFSGIHLGPVVLLPPGDSNGDNMVGTSVKYFSKFSSIPSPSLQGLGILNDDIVGEGFQFKVSAHDSSTYRRKLQYLRDNGSNPLDSSGFTNGSTCNHGNECSTNLCVGYKCSGGGDGERCKSDADCISGRCDISFSNGGQTMCFDKKSKGELCNENADCESGVCSWRWRCS